MTMSSSHPSCSANSFGAMAARKASTSTGAPVGFPAHVATPVMRTHTGPENQAAAVIAWPTGGGIAAITDSRRLDVLAMAKVSDEQR